MKNVLQWVVLSLVAILAVIVLPPLFTRERPSCPNHNYPVWNADDSFTEVPLAGAITDIPEFHDCQRLLVHDLRQKRLSYGPLAGIWVAEFLDQRLAELTKLNSSPRVVMALAFVELYSWDGTYPPLGIGKKWNCLYLYPKPDTLTLGAKMVQVSDRNACLLPQSLAALKGDTVRNLSVTRDTIPGFTGNDYPAVGRWDWDPVNQRQYIGLKCGAAWCEVSDTLNHHSSARYAEGTAAVAANRTLQVKGWYDEQRLAVPKFGLIGSLPSWLAGVAYWWLPVEPAAFAGTIVPDTGLAERPLTDFSSWVDAGYVVVGGSQPKYEQFNYGPGSLPTANNPGAMAKVSLCHGPNCGESRACPGNNSANPTEKDWWARIEYNGTVKYRCVKRVDHSRKGRSIPGTARWFWEAKDEKGWYGCGAGCCTVQ